MTGHFPAGIVTCSSTQACIFSADQLISSFLVSQLCHWQFENTVQSPTVPGTILVFFLFLTNCSCFPVNRNLYIFCTAASTWNRVLIHKAEAEHDLRCVSSFYKNFTNIFFHGAILHLVPANHLRRGPFMNMTYYELQIVICVYWVIAQHAAHLHAPILPPISGVKIYTKQLTPKVVEIVEAPFAELRYASCKGSIISDSLLTISTKFKLRFI